MNEIPVNIFTGMGAVLVILIGYSVLRKDLEYYTHILAAGMATFLSIIMSLMILNGNVVMVYATAAGAQYVKVQSIPVHYLLLSIGIIMAAFTGLLVWNTFKSFLTGEDTVQEVELEI